jgi:hypothetical protein
MHSSSRFTITTILYIIISDNNEKKYVRHKISSTGLIWVENDLIITPEVLFDITGIDDIQRLDREMDHLRSLEILRSIGSGFNIDEMIVNIISRNAIRHTKYSPL